VRQRALAALTLTMIVGSPAFAEPTTPPPTPAPLSGPKVEDRPREDTIVARDFRGGVVRAETTPEEAAVRLMGLTGIESAPLDKIFLERARELDEFVVKNIDLLIKLNTAGATGDKGDQLKLLLEAGGKLRGLWAHGTLRKRVRAALPPERLAEFDTLMKEYDDAVVAEKHAATPAGQKPEGRFGVLLGERLESLGREIARAYQRQEASGDLIYAFLLRDADLSADQEKKVKNIIRAYADATRGREPSEKEKADLYFRVMKELNDAQRDAFNAVIFGK
jgi:hypothetical protein